MTLEQSILAIFLSAILAFVAFIAVDCMGGKPAFLECSVTGHQYIPARVETEWHNDSEGKMHCTTVHHPEQYLVFAEGMDTHESFTISTSGAEYHAVTNGQIITVKCRVGKWSKANYLPRIHAR